MEIDEGQERQVQRPSMMQLQGLEGANNPWE